MSDDDDDRTRDDADQAPDEGQGDGDGDGERLAEVIPLGSRTSPDDDAATAPAAPRPATPPRTLLGSLVREIADRLADEARANRIDDSPVLRLLDADPEHTDDSDTDGDGDRDVVDLTAERLRRKGPGPSAVDIGNIVREGFEHYVDEHAGEMDLEDTEREPTGDDPTPKRTLKIDGDFVRRHGASLLPALLNGLAESVGANLAGLAAPPPRPPAAQPTDDQDDEAHDDEDDTPADRPALRAHDPASEPARPRTEVKLDLLSVLAALIQPPATSTARSGTATPAPDQDEQNDDDQDDDGSRDS